MYNVHWTMYGSEQQQKVKSYFKPVLKYPSSIVLGKQSTLEHTHTISFDTELL